MVWLEGLSAATSDVFICCEGLAGFTQSRDRCTFEIVQKSTN